jgi:hypothetical protein
VDLTLGTLPIMLKDANQLTSSSDQKSGKKREILYSSLEDSFQAQKITKRFNPLGAVVGGLLGKMATGFSSS